MQVIGFKNESLSATGRAILCAALLLIAGCAGPLFGDGLDLARDVGTRAGMTEFRIDTGDFVLSGFRSNHQTARKLALYIEGDGYAYASRTQPSTDPTPKDPVGLRLAAVAAQHPHPDIAVVYLARPCQYLRGDGDQKRCNVLHWTLHRFAPEVVAAYQTALSTLMRQFGASSVELYGYSGGGTVAALLAGATEGEVRLTTFAAVLDLDTWVSVRRLTPLSGSLNPAETPSLADIPQTHYIGQDDDRVPLEIAQSYVRRIGGLAENSLFYAPDVDHDCCWDKFWESGYAKQ